MKNSDYITLGIAEAFGKLFSGIMSLIVTTLCPWEDKQYEEISGEH